MIFGEELRLFSKYVCLFLLETRKYYRPWAAFALESFWIDLKSPGFISPTLSLTEDRASQL